MSTIKSAWKIEDIAVGKTVRLATRIMDSGKKAYFFFSKNNADSSTGFDEVTLTLQMVDDLIKVGWTTR